MLEQLIISIQIILIDIVMAADNAIIIGLIASSFASDNRRKIIAWGIDEDMYELETKITTYHFRKLH